MTLVSGLFKIVCATCPAHAVVHEQVRYQDGLIIHYECHGKQFIVAMYPYISRVITHRDGGRYQYAFNVQKPDLGCLHEKVDCIYVLDTELESLSPDKVTEMSNGIAERLKECEGMEKPSYLSAEEWSEVLEEARRALTMLSKFKES